MSLLRPLLQRLLRIEDTPKRTALAFSIGVFLGFSPYLGFHTLLGIAIAVVFRLNRLAVLLGVWSNTPWFLIPFYTFATWVGMQLTGVRIDLASFRELFQLGVEGGFWSSLFWSRLAGQRGILLSFLIGSNLLALLLSLAAYPLSLKWIRLLRNRGKAVGNGSQQ
jgi:uncharacterized protein (DUF2062 family)